MNQIRKTIIFDENMVNKIEKLAEESERDFSGQVRWIIKEYINNKEKSPISVNKDFAK